MHAGLFTVIATWRLCFSQMPWELNCRMAWQAAAGRAHRHLALHDAPHAAVTFPILFALGLVAEGLRFSSWTAVGYAAILYGPLLLVTVLIHEMGHSMAARRVGGHAEGILLWPLGGLAYLAHSSGPKGAPAAAAAGGCKHARPAQACLLATPAEECWRMPGCSMAAAQDPLSARTLQCWF